MHGHYLQIAGGTVYDPTNFVDGQVRDVWILDGKIVPTPLEDVKSKTTIDAHGLVVMPGGVDMHCHIAGPKVNAARLMTMRDKVGVTGVSVERGQALSGSPPKGQTPFQIQTAGLRSGTWGPVPSTFTTGYRYLGLGYTTAFDAAVPPLGSRHAHQQLDDTPCIDKGFYVLVGNHEYVLDAIADGDAERLQAFLGWLVQATKAYSLKLVNPGGVAAWRSTRFGNVTGLDDESLGRSLSPRKILQAISAAAGQLRLPHGVHVHCNQLGMPGNWQTTLQTMQALDGQRAHLTHIQFHSYGGGDGDEGTLCSRVAPLADYVNGHEHLTVDVGQVLFDKTVTMTADSPAAHYLARLQGSTLFAMDVECEAGCGVAPIQYRHRSLVNSWQWAAGLEWYLLVDDPWKIAMSTDHPNGGSFVAYPQVIQLLMDRNYRQEALQRLHRKVREQSLLRDLDREYTLGEIATITRAAPARMLGLSQKGHLGPGADADVAIYTPSDDRLAMFSLPRHVIKSGQVVIRDGEWQTPLEGSTLFADAAFDNGYLPEFADWFERHYSIEFGNYGVLDGELHSLSAQPC